jgi:hypothetical protein
MAAVVSLLISCMPWLAQLPRLKTRADIARQLFLPPALHLWFNRHRPEGFDAGDALHQEGLVLRTALELLIKPLAEDRSNRRRYGGIKRDGDENDASKNERMWSGVQF